MLPEILIPHWITRAFISQHKELTFLYSDDYLGNSFQGQAAQAAGESNAFPIPVKRRGICRRDDAYFYDKDFDLHCDKLEYYFERIPLDKPIIPFPRIGEGDSEIQTKAPKLYAYIMKRIAKMAYPNIRRV